MKVVWSEAQLAHDPQFYLLRGNVMQNFETPERGRVLLEACRTLGLEVSEPAQAERSVLEKVHEAGYIDFLSTAAEDWGKIPGGGLELIPSMFPTPEMFADGVTLPAHIIGRAGWYVVGAGAPISRHTWASARAAADCAVQAALDVASGTKAVYALTRPPGHHAYAARASGHCFLNNAAIAAEVLRAKGVSKVGILDVDVHHGNGTQHIFWTRPDVVTVSVHGDPNYQYPWYVGLARERGAGLGQGANFNLPLEQGTGDEAWLEAISAGLKAIESCDAIILPLGFDTSEHEPLGFFSVTETAYARLGTMLAATKKPIVITQEGGYCVEALGGLLTRFMQGLED
jgi:acetoin utilization deacetylase AcuC-like enzyme